MSEVRRWCAEREEAHDAVRTVQLQTTKVINTTTHNLILTISKLEFTLTVVVVQCACSPSAKKKKRDENLHNLRNKMELKQTTHSSGAVRAGVGLFARKSQTNIDSPQLMSECWSGVNSTRDTGSE